MFAEWKQLFFSGQLGHAIGYVLFENVFMVRPWSTWMMWGADSIDQGFFLAELTFSVSRNEIL